MADESKEVDIEDRAGDVHAALLRGINVGGRNRLPMERLRAIFADAGCRSIRTYIQSGNVVFEAPPAVAERLPTAVPDLIEEELGFRVPVVVRCAAELEDVVAGNPFGAATAEAGILHVVFLADEPDPDAVERLEPDRSPPDEFVVRGREIYLRCPNGMARTKLTNAYFDSRLDTVSTMRNWRTTLKLLKMAREA